MIETVGGGVSLALLSGLAFLAYNHPDEFKPVGRLLLSILCLTWPLLAIWAICAHESSNWIRYHTTKTEPSDYDKFSSIAGDYLNVFLPAWVIYLVLIIPLVCIYLGVLLTFISNLKKKPN